MRKIAIATVTLCLSALLGGCSVTNGLPVQSIPTPTAMTSETPDAAPGDRANPLAVGELRKITTTSAWSVGADAPTERGQGYVVLPLHVQIDWDAAEANGANPDDGADPWGSLLVSFVSAAGRTYDRMEDYSVDIPNELYELGAVYEPTTDISANVAVSVPDAEVDGGAWRIENLSGAAVWIAID